MKRLTFILLYFAMFIDGVYPQDSLMFKGQLSGWMNYNPDNDLPAWAGGRYIPRLNYEVQFSGARMIDFELSANLNAVSGFRPFDTCDFSANGKPYRAWGRYSSRQFELRLGLQKINFGSASMLRPLMWFDQIDPRDPLQLTDGVWGMLGRYYLLNNANIWLWVLYGNEGPKTWELGRTNQDYPEFGGRVQHPVPGGEAAVSYHFRMADTKGLGGGIPSWSEIPENRIGLDGKWDAGIGIWFEGVWINKVKDLDTLTNQEMLTLGADYTFAVGNGLNATLENLWFAYGEKAFDISNAVTSFTALSMNYPVGLFDHINTILYYDWKNENIYSFVNWQKQFRRLDLYVMVYWNPEKYILPKQADTDNLFSGKGIQIMIVYNH